MAAPTYTWEFNCDLMGDRVPKVTTLAAATGLYTKIGTLLSMSSGHVIATTDGAGATIIGLAAETIAVSSTENDPVKVAVLAPGMVIKGTAVDTAASVSGFTSKAIDLDADGRLDPDDTTGGGLSVWKTEDAGLTVYCVVGTGAIIG
jgi:hypothetical protein